MYGELPKLLGEIKINCEEVLYYQYLPIKLSKGIDCTIEDRLKPFKELLGTICCDFVGEYGLDRYVESNIYITVKRKYLDGPCSFNRNGYHSDGFMTDDINYIWCDKNPTIFNNSKFNLSQDDELSLIEMEKQAKKENEVQYPINSLLRLTQDNIHKVSENKEYGIRTFVKVSFSKDKYNLLGNSKNHLLDYNWDMKPRSRSRNIPQKNER